jgi:hypothetical protein
MYVCEVCGSVIVPGTPQTKIVVETRPVEYPVREKVHFRPGADGGKGKWIDDPGGSGIEIVRELRVCPSCADDLPAEQLAASAIASGDRSPTVLKDHESAVRAMMAEARGQPYVSYRTLAEARSAGAAIVIIEGDYGGQIYLTTPVQYVGCTEARLTLLAEELELLCWMGRQRFEHVVFEPGLPGRRVAGGMGGGLVIDGVWVHEEIRQLGLADVVTEILAGRRDALPDPDPDVTPEARAAIVKAFDDRVDVFCTAFGFPSPAYMRKMHRDEWRRREAAAIPEPTGYSRWYWPTLRAVARRAGRSVGK